jgi:hypothetical protein
MKNFVLSCLTVLLFASPVLAHEKIDVNAKVDMMKKELNLSDDQVKSVKPVIEDYKNAVEQAGKNKEDKLSSILSKDQMDKMKDLMKDKEKMEK